MIKTIKLKQKKKQLSCKRAVIELIGVYLSDISLDKNKLKYSHNDDKQKTDLI